MKPGFVRDDRGEVSSWLILAAGLVLAAVVASSLLGGAIGGLASRVGVASSAAGLGNGVAVEPLVAVAALIDNGDDGGISEGELDDIHALLAALAVDELDQVLASLDDQQLERLFSNVHSSGVFSNDWNDDERQAFYDVLAALPRSAKTETWRRLGEFSPRIDANPDLPVHNEACGFTPCTAIADGDETKRVSDQVAAAIEAGFIVSECMRPIDGVGTPTCSPESVDPALILHTDEIDGLYVQQILMEPEVPGSVRTVAEVLTSPPVIGDVADPGWCVLDSVLAKWFGGSKVTAGISCAAAAAPGLTAGGAAIVGRTTDDIIDGVVDTTRALPAVRQVNAPWGPLFDYRHGTGPMTAIEHVNYRHAFDSGFDDVSRFSQGTTSTQIRSLVDDALRYGNVTHDGASITFNTGRHIGFDRFGNPVTGLQVWIRDGVIRTAYPIVSPT